MIPRNQPLLHDACMADRVFGEIPGMPVGTGFTSRREVADSGVHRPTQAGISGSGLEGADSIVVSGGYEDDEDLGNVIIYRATVATTPTPGSRSLTRSSSAAISLWRRAAMTAYLFGSCGVLTRDRRTRRHLATDMTACIELIGTGTR